MSSLNVNPKRNQDTPQKMGQSAYSVVFLLAALLISLLAALFGVSSIPGAALSFIALCSLALGVSALFSGERK